MLRRSLTLFMILIPLLVAQAEFDLSGDILVRPRLQVISDYDSSGEQLSSDLDSYWLYRARANIRISTDDGFMVAAQLGHESPVQLSIMGKPDQSSVDWILAYGGKRFQRGELYAGRVPLPYTPLLDLLNYPDLAANLPWLALDHLSVTGVKGGLDFGAASLRGFFAIDEDNSFTEIDSDSTTSWSDGFSCGIIQQSQLGAFKLEPQFYYSSDRSCCNNQIVGVSIQTDLAGFTVKTTAGYTHGESGSYTGALYHFELLRRLGPGLLHFFYNYAPIEYASSNDIATSFIWLDYSWDIFNSEQGRLFVRPTWRWFNRDRGDTGSLIRNRFELTVVMEVR